MDMWIQRDKRISTVAMQYDHVYREIVSSMEIPKWLD